MDELYNNLSENWTLTIMGAICLLVIAYLGARQISNWWARRRFQHRKHRSRRSSHRRSRPPGNPTA